jgi:CspA family cold shock protein
MTGKISYWKRDSGFGFAIPADDSDDVFVHWSHLPTGIRRLLRGQEIEFTPVEHPGNKSRLATNIKILDAPEVSGASDGRN